MTTTQVRGRLVTPTGVVEDGLVVVTASVIEYVGPAAAATAPTDRSATVTVPHDGYVLPGLVDVHDHGGGGASFTAGEADQIATATSEHALHGTTTMLASTVTDAPDRMLQAVAALAEAVGRGELAGIHVEGPFLAASRCGAQDPRFLADPDVGFIRDLIDAAQGHLKSMTIAPELAGADEVIDRLFQHGVVPAVGHTDADAGRVRETLARTHAALGRPGLVTHLFNGMSPLHHRDPGPVAGALTAAADGDALVELIADGVHLHDDTIRMVFRLLGPDRVGLVTDAMAAAGMPDGDYELGSQQVTVDDGIARIGSDGPLAGGTAHLLDVVRRCVRAGVDIVDAVTAATRTPARAAGLGGTAGVLAPGGRADLVITDANLRPVAVMRAGDWLG
ncbi:MAG: N-acetylglucosamine-6-phosphate deacetylase [Actinomycetota bacterium]